MRAAIARLLLVALALPTLGFDWQGRVARLERELASADASTRRDAVRQLGAFDRAEVSAALLRALDDSDGAVRLEAADACARAGVRDATPRLVDWLDEPDAELRVAAVRSLGRLAEARSTPALVRALADAQPTVRRAAVRALASIGGPEVIVPLLGRLDDVETDVRVESADALGRLADQRALVPLVGRVRDAAPEVRAAAIAALGTVADARAEPALLQALRDDVPDVRLAAITALGRLAAAAATGCSERRGTTASGPCARTEAVAPLGAIARGTDSRAARAAVAALGSIDSPAALDEVVHAALDPDTRTTAREVLLLSARDSSAPRAAALVARLARALDDAASSDVGTLAELLVAIAPWTPTASATDALLRALDSGRAANAPLLRALGASGSPTALVPLLERLASADAAERLVALDSLDAYFARAPADGRAADPLLAALGRANAPERLRIVGLLARVRATRAVGPLRALLGNRDPELRIAVARALGAIGDRHAASDLGALLSDRDDRLRYEAARAFGAVVSAEDLDRLLASLSANAPTDRHALLLTLSLALPRLRAARAIDPARAARIARTLAALLSSPDDALAARAATTLAAWGDPLAAAPLSVAAERSPDRRSWLVRALGGIDDDAALAALRARLTDPSPDVVLAAAGALGEHGDSSDAERLLALAQRAPWPVPAASSFSIARMAFAGRLEPSAALTSRLCALGRLRDGNVRANVAVTLAALGGASCPDSSPAAWLTSSASVAVRAASARWLRATMRADAADRDAARRALDRCVDSDAAPEVVEACRATSEPLRDSVVDAYAYGPGASARLAGSLVALRLADGSVLVLRTDPLAHVWLGRAPRGRIAIDDPAALPLERR